MIRTTLLLLGAALALPQAAPSPAAAQAATEVYRTLDNPRLMQDFGGIEGIRALMEVFEQELIRNPTTRPFFAGRDNTRTKAMLTDQVCQILGGGCVYRGATMRESHASMGVNQAHFLALVEAFQIAMDRRGIPFTSQNQLLAVLAPMHRDIITR